MKNIEGLTNGEHYSHVVRDIPHRILHNHPPNPAQDLLGSIGGLWQLHACPRGMRRYVDGHGVSPLAIVARLPDMEDHSRRWLWNPVSPILRGATMMTARTVYRRPAASTGIHKAHGGIEERYGPSNMERMGWTAREIARLGGSVGRHDARI